MYIDQEIFQYYCSSATTPKGSGIFDRVQKELQMAEAILMSYMGDEVYNSLPDEDPRETSDNLLNLCADYVCNRAYYMAIPHLDLVLTETGFGVVHNNNVAPASRERVEALSRRIREVYEDVWDEITDTLRHDSRWNTTSQALTAFNSLLWRGSQMTAFGIVVPHRSDLDEKREKIAAAEILLANTISPQQLAELTSSMRLGTTTELQQQAIDLAIKFIASKCDGQYGGPHLAMNALLLFLEDHLSDFPAFATSPAYEALKAQRYENTKESSCYFFGSR